MDTFTHIAIGACIGEAFFNKTIGKKAMFLGAMAHSIPDLDFLASFWMDSSSFLLAHRGFTHSFLFSISMILLLSLLAFYFQKTYFIKLSKWVLFFSVSILLHIFIDAFNNYGVGWFEPFSHYRISFNAMYVLDPFFSIWFFIAFFGLLNLNSKSVNRTKIWQYTFGITAFYLVYCMYNKSMVDQEINNSFKKQHIQYSTFISTPAPLQNWLWYFVAKNDIGFYIGYYSIFDTNKLIPVTYFLKNDSLIQSFDLNEELTHLIRFSQGYYTIEKRSDTLVFNDLRFGEVLSCQKLKEHFVFHYFLNQPKSNTLVVQRGRFSGWDLNTFKCLIHRIEGFH